MNLNFFLSAETFLIISFFTYEPNIYYKIPEVLVHPPQQLS
jgi:hypothetical protein